jgi:hypothetical protein
MPKVRGANLLLSLAPNFSMTKMIFISRYEVNPRCVVRFMNSLLIIESFSEQATHNLYIPTYRTTYTVTGALNL